MFEPTYPVSRLTAGQSFGNADAFIRTSATGDLEGLYSAGTDQWPAGEVRYRLEAGGGKFSPIQTRFEAACQTTSFACEGLGAELICFVPRGQELERCCAWLLSVRNPSDACHEVSITVDLRWNAVTAVGHSKVPPGSQGEKVVESRLDGHRVVAVTRRQPYTVNPAWFLPPAVTEHGDPREWRSFEGPSDLASAAFTAPGRVTLTFLVKLGPGERRELPFQLHYGQGTPERPSVDVAALLAATRKAVAHELARATLHTPSAAIDALVHWAKASTLRVQQRFPAAWGFTNDPPQDVLVVRDAAWYALGASYLSPGFVADMWQLILDHGQHPGGKLTEYLRCAQVAPDGRVFREDYGLDLNDDTPLFIWATCHHAAVTGDRPFFDRTWPAVREAADWLLSRRGPLGLLWCGVDGTNTYGIASWRNIIPGYGLSGAVTEINAEAVNALRAAARMAAVTGDTACATRYEAAAEDLVAAIEALLNRPTPATACEDVTGDQVFPLLFEVAPPDRAQRVASRLLAEDSWTTAGVRTVGKSEPSYHPTFGWGLLGGIWPNLTAWVAYALRSSHPGRLVEALLGLHALIAPEDPSAMGRLVPGEFPEWFDGDTMVSKGMAMSPWMPPTALWLALEGLAGITPRLEGPPEVEPHLPEGWTWLAASSLPGPEGPWSWFLHDGVLRSTRPVVSSRAVRVLPLDLTVELATDAPVFLALAGEDGTDVLVGRPSGPGVAEQYRVRLGSEERTVRLAPGEAQVLAFAPDVRKDKIGLSFR